LNTAGVALSRSVFICFKSTSGSALSRRWYSVFFCLKLRDGWSRRKLSLVQSRDLLSRRKLLLEKRKLRDLARAVASFIFI
jgi:hypothetical protein